MLELNRQEWKEFSLASIFSIDSTSSGIDKAKLKKDSGKYPYVTRSNINNGINSFVCSQRPYNLDHGNCIIIGLDTQTVFYQKSSFYTGQNIQILRNEKLNAHNALFFIPLLHNTLDGLYWGGNGATLTRLKRSKIILPTDDFGNPNYDFMEQYIKERELQLLQKYTEYADDEGQINEEISLDDREWKTFNIGELFTVTGTKTTIPEKLQTHGETPRITCAATDNGFDNTYKNSPTEKGQVLTVDSATIGTVFYQNTPFIATDHVEKLLLKNKQMSKHLGLFLSQAIRSSTRDKYGYGYKFSQNRINRQVILLPISSSDSPDYAFMEEYMKQKEKRLIKEYMEYISNR